MRDEEKQSLMLFFDPGGRIVFLWCSHPGKYNQENVTPACLPQGNDGMSVKFALKRNKYLEFSVFQNKD